MPKQVRHDNVTRTMFPKPKKNRSVYLDHAATTPMDPEVLKAMRPFFSENYGNPSALYDLGLKSNRALSKSRQTIAELLHTNPDTIVFTSGGTESDNLAIFGIVHATPPFQGGARLAETSLSLSRRVGGGLPSSAANDPTLGSPRRRQTPPNLPLERGGSHAGHIITTPIEHHAVLNPIQKLEKEGWSVTYVSVDKYGRVDPNEVIRAIRPESVLISVMYANNEIGTIEPIAEIGRGLLRYRKEKGTSYPYFHTDACQAAGFLELDVEKLHVDLMTLNGSKIYGPKGVGLLYIRRGTPLAPLIIGGEQEHGLRAGTENIPAIVGLAKALEISQKNREKESDKESKLTTYFWKKLQEKIPGATLNGPEIGESRLPNNLNISIPGIEGEKLLFYLNEYGIMCSTGSACATQTRETSHVLRAIGLPEEKIYGSLRFSLGKNTTKQDIDYTVTNLSLLVKELK